MAFLSRIQTLLITLTVFMSVCLYECWLAERISLIGALVFFILICRKSLLFQKIYSCIRFVKSKFQKKVKNIPNESCIYFFEKIFLFLLKCLVYKCLGDKILSYNNQFIHFIAKCFFILYFAYEQYTTHHSNLCQVNNLANRKWNIHMQYSWFSDRKQKSIENVGRSEVFHPNCFNDYRALNV